MRLACAGCIAPGARCGPPPSRGLGCASGGGAPRVCVRAPACVCVCACARARACVRAPASVRVLLRARPRACRPSAVRACVHCQAASQNALERLTSQNRWFRLISYAKLPRNRVGGELFCILRSPHLCAIFNSQRSLKIVNRLASSKGSLNGGECTAPRGTA